MRAVFGGFVEERAPSGANDAACETSRADSLEDKPAGSLAGSDGLIVLAGLRRAKRCRRENEADCKPEHPLTGRGSR